jgi:hypothetical protein
MRSTSSLALSAAIFAGGLTAGQVDAAIYSPEDLTEPIGWSVGDLNTTYQEWDGDPAPGTPLPTAGGAPDDGYFANPAPLSSPTISASGGNVFSSSTTGNYYSFSGNYNVAAFVPQAPTVGGSGYGTHVIVQTGSSIGAIGSVLSADIDRGDGGAVQVVQAATQMWFASGLPSFGGPTDAEVLLWEFWLPEFTGDFTVNMVASIHSSFDQLRVDTAVVQSGDDGGSPFAAIPEPSSALLLLSAGGLLLRRRRNA